MEIFDSCVHRGDAGANRKFFKFEIGNTGFIRGNRVTWCPDVAIVMVVPASCRC
jgi:hypothetical protein